MNQRGLTARSFLFRSSPTRKKSMHTKKKFVIWLSVFLSLLLAGFSLTRSEVQKETPRSVEEIPISDVHPNAWAVNDALAYVRATNANHFYEYVRAHPPKPKVVAAPSPPQEQAPPEDASDVEQIIYSYFGSGSLGHSARAVAKCESGLDPTAVSPGGGNFGLFQINVAHNSPDAKDPHSFQAVTGLPWSATLQAGPNTKYAKYLYDTSQGWGPWGCRWAA